MASCALSGHVYLSRPDDKALYDEVYGVLKDMADKKIYGFGEVLTREEVVKKYGLDGGFSFVIEGDGYTRLYEDLQKTGVKNLNETDYLFGHSSHGHMPEKGPQPPFMAMGPSFKKGVVVAEGNILNHAPTFAKVLGIDLPDAHGKAVDEILK